MTKVLEPQRGQGGTGENMVVACVRHCAVGTHAREVIKIEFVFLVFSGLDVARDEPVNQEGQGREAAVLG